MRPGSFARELELERLEARAAQQVGEYLSARWRTRAVDLDRAPPLPALFADPALARTLDGWRAESRRAEMLWRWCALAGVEADSAVRAALATGGAADVVAARNGAARARGWPSYWSLGLALAELDDVAWSRPARDERPAPGLAEQLAAARDPDRALELVRAGFASWGLSLEGVRLDVALLPNPDAPVRARTFPVSPPGDIRVYVRAPLGQRGWRALAHELGHAVYARHRAVGGPWSLRAAPSRVLDEAVAFLGECVVAGADPGAAAGHGRRAAAERAAYAGEGVPEPAPGWLISDPVAQPAYAAAVGLANALWRRVAALAPAERGPWLIEHVFAPGACQPMGALLARAGISWP